MKNTRTPKTVKTALTAIMTVMVTLPLTFGNLGPITPLGDEDVGYSAESVIPGTGAGYADPNGDEDVGYAAE